METDGGVYLNCSFAACVMYPVPTDDKREKEARGNEKMPFSP